MLLLFSALMFARFGTAIYGKRDDRADRQLPVMSPKLIVVADAKEREARSGFLSKPPRL